ncbi:SusC/RagA family TonB-linked outer membrane protein [Pedobacter frigoris]|uniref:SusC/RagA family TonB-linked outer membrane protein n=1 Tax=Pedobacter frigoris TaxID=2571272 RepID=UPI0029311796|nr:SusC/RagA family TonB-linked outer membrane protein [Pedobacter frigoris]
MRLTTVILIASLMQVSAATFGQRVTLKEKDTPLERVIEKLRKQTGYDFLIMDYKLITDAKKVNLDVKNVSLEEALESIFENQKLSYTIKDKSVAIKEKEPSFLDNLVAHFSAIDIRGKIIGENDQVLAGATVKVKGTNRVTKSNEKGEFYLANVDEDAMLEISYVGFKTLEIQVQGAVMPLEIKLNVATGELEEVNVTYSTGYQNIPKERATGSFVQIDNKTYNEQVGANFLNRLPAIANSVNVFPARNRPNQIAVRGLSTISGPKQPLIVVDNFPYEGDLNNINPNDIESIDILRDAAAASIWGARAGNGVIVVNTKKGKLNEKTRVEFGANLTSTLKPDLFYSKSIATSDFIDVEKYLFDNGYYDYELNNRNWGFQTDVVDILEKKRKSLIDPDDADRQINVLRGYDVRRDYEKYMYQNGIDQQYSIGLRGGSKSMVWSLSGGIDKGIDELAAKSDRYNFRLEQLYKPIDQLQLFFGVDYANTHDKNGKTEYGAGPFSGGVIPYGRFIADDGSQIPFTTYRRGYLDTLGNGRLLDWKYYPLEDYKHATRKTDLQSVIAKIGLNYRILKGFNFDVKYLLEKQHSKLNLLNDQESFFTRDMINFNSNINRNAGVVNRAVPLGSILDLTTTELRNQNLRAQVNVDQNWGHNSINAIAGVEMRDVQSESSLNRSYGYDKDLLTSKPVDYINSYPLVDPFFGSGTVPFISVYNRLQNRYVSLFTNIAYNYGNRYTASFSARRDASNIFGAETNEKWSPLWSAGLAWNISGEGFYKSQLVPYLKLRATYGFNGNVSPTLSSVTTIRYATASIYTSGPTARISNFKNSDLTWEKVGMLNLGLDFRAGWNVLEGSIEYFQKNAKDLYGPAVVDRTLGLATPTIQKNVANLRGQGVDVILTSHNIKRQIKWSSMLNFSYYNDKVTSYYNSDERADSYVFGGQPHEGYPLNSVFSFKWAGLDPLTGDPRGYLNGKPSKNYTALQGDSATIKDLSFHGSAIPVFFGSLGNTLSYKNLSLSVKLTYQLGYYFMRQSIDYGALISQRIGHADFVQRWQTPGDELKTNVPSMQYPVNYNREYFYNNSDVLATKGDHIRLQYINLSYTLERARNPKMPFSTLRVFVVGNELGLLWKANKQGIDPRAIYDGQLPASKNFSIGFNANF